MKLSARNQKYHKRREIWFLCGLSSYAWRGEDLPLHLPWCTIVWHIHIKGTPKCARVLRSAAKQKSNGASVLTVAVGASVLTVVRAWRYASYAQLATASDHLDGRARYNIPAVPRPVEALLPSSGSACWGETRELGARRYHQSWATPDPPSPFPLCYPVSCKS